MAEHTDVEQEVLAANRGFYAAWEAGDLEAMMGLWVPDGHAICVHPGWAPVEGVSAVRRSWAVIMANTAYIQFFLTDVTVGVIEGVAAVGCTENVLAADDQTPIEGFSGGKAVTTNVFRRTTGDWRLWIHHASPVMSQAGSDEGV
ncbi:MAG: DUF4440 domain-containing protein [Propionibacteriales bacterium]|nr:DUF4440 domain-containing protein [Propionibacteriales bacterium]